MKSLLIPRKWIFLLLLILPFEMTALDNDKPFNQYIQTSWTTKEGLITDVLLDVLQDQKGYIWLGTYEGLIRFDGNRFVTFNQSRTDGFPGNSARVLKEAPDGTLWVGTNDKGLIHFSDRVLKVYSTADGLPSNSIRAIEVDSSGDIWIGTVKGLARVDQEGNLQTFSQFRALKERLIHFIYRAPNETLWVGTEKGEIFLKYPEKELFHTFTKPERLKNQIITHILIDRQKSIWYVDLEGKITATNSEGNIHHEFSAQDVRQLYEDSSGAVWAATANGIIRFFNNQISIFTENQGLPGNLTSSVIEDREGNIFILTSRGGLLKLTDGKFITYTTHDGLCYNQINCLMEDTSERVWIGTDRGLSILEKGQFISHPLVTLLKTDRVRHIYEDSRKTIWISTYGDSGLVSWSDKGVLSLYTQSNGLASNKVRVTCEDSRGFLWVGTKNGLSRIDLNNKTETIKSYTTSDGLSNDFIMSLSESKNGILWIGTDGGGLNYFRNNKFNFYSKEEGLAGNIIFRTREDANGRLWITTSEGISIFTRDSFNNILLKGGFITNSIFQVLEDNIGYTWFTSTRGLFVIPNEDLNNYTEGTTSTLKIRTFNATDGLSPVTSTSWSMKDKRGRLWFPTNEGVAMIDPANIPRNNIRPLVNIEKIEIDHQVSLPIDEKFVPEDNKRIHFVYTGLSFTEPGQILFQYKLDGFDTDWSPPTNKREATYTNLPPGNYRFRIKAINKDGIFSKKEAVYTFTLLSPWYNSNWITAIYASLFIAIALGAFLVIRRLKSHLRTHKVWKSEIFFSRLNSQFIANTLIALRRLLPESPEKAGTAIDKLSLISRKIKQFDTKKTDTLENEIRYIESYLELEKMNRGEHLKWSIDINKGLQEINLPVFSLRPIIEFMIEYHLTCSPIGGIIKIKGNRSNTIDLTIKSEPFKAEYDSLQNALLKNALLENNLLLKNIRKRLTEHYGNKAKLKANFTDKIYTVTINIPV